MRYHVFYKYCRMEKENDMPYPYSYDYEAQRKEKEYKRPKLKTNRKMWQFMLFSILTLGIYGVIFFVPFSYDLDKIAPKRDGTRTISYAFVFVLSLFTASIVMLFWHYHIAERVNEALEKRNISYNFGTSTFWGWYFFGSFILVGPFIYFHKLFKAMNLLCADYNEKPIIE